MGAAGPRPVSTEFTIRAFFKSHLGFRIFLRMVWPGPQPVMLSLTQPFANSLLAHTSPTTRGDLLAQIDTAPAHHLMSIRIWPVDHDGFQFFHLPVCQTWRTS